MKAKGDEVRRNCENDGRQWLPTTRHWRIFASMLRLLPPSGFVVATAVVAAVNSQWNDFFCTQHGRQRPLADWTSTRNSNGCLIEGPSRLDRDHTSDVAAQLLLVCFSACLTRSASVAGCRLGGSDVAMAAGPGSATVWPFGGDQRSRRRPTDVRRNGDDAPPNSEKKKQTPAKGHAKPGHTSRHGCSNRRFDRRSKKNRPLPAVDYRTTPSRCFYSSAASDQPSN